MTPSGAPLFSYHVSQEQFAPAELLDLVQRAETAGFDAAFSSDHLQPWAPAQGESGFTWSWLGAALQATRRLQFGTITVPSGWRYHPVVLAQAVATLSQMFPSRVPWVALGSGEAINEGVVSSEWPSKEERNARLREGALIMQALLAGEVVNHRGRIAAVDARLWSLPQESTRLVGAAVSAETARWLGTWADGLLTTAATIEAFREIVAAFREGGGVGKPVYFKTQVSWAESDEEALRSAFEQWRCNCLSSEMLGDLATPDDFARAACNVELKDVEAQVFVSSRLDDHTAWLRELMALGAESIDIHNVGRNQRAFIEAFGQHILPRLRP